VAYLKVASTGALITPYVSLSKRQAVSLAVNTALDGTEYLVRFGSPTASYELTVNCDLAGRNTLFNAQDSLAELEVKVKEGTFRGRIKEMDNFESEWYGWFSTKIVLSAVSEVTER